MRGMMNHPKFALCSFRGYICYFTAYVGRSKSSQPNNSKSSIHHQQQQPAGVSSEKGNTRQLFSIHAPPFLRFPLLMLLLMLTPVGLGPIYVHHLDVNYPSRMNTDAVHCSALSNLNPRFSLRCMCGGCVC